MPLRGNKHSRNVKTSSSMRPFLVEGEHRGQVDLCWEAQVVLESAGLGVVVRAVKVGVVGQGVGARLQPVLVGGWATPLKNMKVNWED